MTKKKIKTRIEKLVEYETKTKLLNEFVKAYLLNCTLGWDGVSLRLDNQGQKQMEALVKFAAPTEYAFKLQRKQEALEAQEEKQLNEKE